MVEKILIFLIQIIFLLYLHCNVRNALSQLSMLFINV